MCRYPPPSLKQGFLKLSTQEIKEKYPERYNAYLRILRAERNNQNIDESELSNIQEWIDALNNLDSYISTHQDKKEKRVLREKQFTVFEDIRNSLEQGKKEGYIKLPTGVGKTVLFSQIVESLGVKTLICVPSKVLVGQTGEKLEEFTDLQFGKYYQEEKDFSKNVTIITYASLIKGIEDGTINPKDYGALILDEAHKALGEKTSEAINKFDCVKLGFTATPKYTDDKHVKDLLEHEIHSMSIAEGVKGGLISRFKSIFAYTEADLSAVDIVDGKYDPVALEKAVNIHARNIAAVQLYKEMFNGQSAITYCSGVTHARDMADLYNKHGVSAAVITGTTTEDERKDIIAKYHSGEIKMLCNVKVLIEGFDEPHASVALNLHPTLSKVDAEQRSGRVLRLDKDNPDKWAYIVDFIDKNAKRPQVTFPQIAGASELEPDPEPTGEPRGGGGGGGSGPKFKTPKIEGLKIVLDTEEIMQMAQNFASNEAVYAPEGWVTANSLGDVASAVTIKKFVEEYRSKHPEWFEEYTTNVGLTEFYSPELVNIIKEHYRQKKVWAPTGWMTSSSLTHEISSTNLTIKTFAQKYYTSNPEWFKEYYTKAGMAEHYSPELVKVIKVYFEKLNSPVPEGWMTAAALGSNGVSDSSIIKNFVEQYRTSNSDWFKDYRSGSRVTEHYSPELVKIIEEHFEKKNTLAPEGWVTASSIARSEEVIGTQKNINKFAEQYRKSHPDWFKEYRTGTLNVEHFSPELVQIILDKFNADKSPGGWLSANTIADEVSSTPLTIKTFAQKYYTSNPEWFKEYRAGAVAAEHYSPELTTLIKNHFTERNSPAPEGWFTAVDLGKKMPLSEGSIRVKADKYRLSNPEWFKEYAIKNSEKDKKDIGNRIAEHYSPALVEIINKYVKEQNSIAPAGWLTANGIATKLKTTNLKEVF